MRSPLGSAADLLNQTGIVGMNAGSTTPDELL
jgi:hypothetical protein